MKPFPSLALLAAALFSVGPVFSAQPESDSRAPTGALEVNGIAAKVNGRVITKNQVAMQLGPMFAMLATQYPRRGPQFELEFNKAKAKVIQELVDREIIMDEFKLLGASIKPHIVDEEVKRIINQQYQGDEAKFREELRRSRLTMDGYREMTREKMVVQAMKAQQFSDTPPPLPGEVQREYDQVKLTLRDTNKDLLTFRKIFIPAADPTNPGSTPEDQLALAEKIAAQLAEGADFAKLAKQHSRDAFMESGGLQEDVPRIDLSPEFAAILADSPVGKIVGPLKDPQGFTLVKLVKLKHGPSPSLEEVRERVETQVRERKNLAQYERWIEVRRKRAMIDVRM